MADHTRLSDDELLRRTAGDREAFGELYDRHVRAVLSELRARGLRTEEALERVEELLDAAAHTYTNGAAALPPAEREAVVARVIEERDYDEIAAASGVTPAAVRQRVSRGLAKLARLGREER